MATANYNFTTVSGTDAIDIESAINTPLTQIDTALKGVSDVSAVFPAICLGDSYLEGYNPGGNTTGWGNAIASITGMTVYNQYQGGLGFNSTAEALLRAAISSHPDAKSVIVGLGVNDRTTALATEITNVKSFINVCNNYPDIKFYIFPCIATGTVFTTGLFDVERACVKALQESDNPKGHIRVFTGCWTWTIDNEWAGSDQLHPTQIGINAIAASMVTALSGGDPTIPTASVDITIGDGTCRVIRVWNTIFGFFASVTKNDGEAFITIKNKQLWGDDFYGFAMSGSDGSQQTFNVKSGVPAPAYGKMTGGYGYFQYTINKEQ